MEYTCTCTTCTRSTWWPYSVHISTEIVLYPCVTWVNAHANIKSLLCADLVCATACDPAISLLLFGNCYTTQCYAFVFFTYVAQAGRRKSLDLTATGSPVGSYLSPESNLKKPLLHRSSTSLNEMESNHTHVSATQSLVYHAMFAFHWISLSFSTAANSLWGSTLSGWQARWSLLR